MKLAFTFRSRTTRALATAAAGLVLLTGTAAASSAFRDLGVANVQGNGYWGIEATVRQHPADQGQTYARVTSGACAALSASTIVFETYLSESEAGDGTYQGELYPVTKAAETAAANGMEGQVVYEPAGASTHVAAYVQVDGLPTGHNLRLCLGTGD